MSRLLLVGAMVALLGARSVSAGVTRDNFLDNTTQDLVTLCTVADDDPLRLAAIGFCHGYIVGVWHFHEQLARGKKHQRIACLPDPPPSRSEAIAMFVEWAKANPQYMGEPPVETLFRFAAAEFPCPPGGGAKR
jgi:hypothetical protein